MQAKACGPFATAHKGDLIALDSLARRYGGRPSEYLFGGMMQFQIDLAAWLAGAEKQANAPEEANVIEW